MVFMPWELKGTWRVGGSICARPGGCGAALQCGDMTAEGPRGPGHGKEAETRGIFWHKMSRNLQTY